MSRKLDKWECPDSGAKSGQGRLYTRVLVGVPLRNPRKPRKSRKISKNRPIGAIFWVFRGGGVGQEIVEFWPPPGPARPWGEVGKGPGRGPARFTPIFSPADQFCSAELSHCLKVSDRRRNTLKSAQHRSESSCAGLRGYRAGYLGLEIQKWVRIVVCI